MSKRVVPDLLTVSCRSRENLLTAGNRLADDEECRPGIRLAQDA